MKSETVKMVAVRTCTILAFAVASVQAMAGGGATYWWENPEVAKSVALAAEAKSPQAMSCDAEGNCLALFDAAGAVKAVYGAHDLQRRKGRNRLLTNSFASTYDFSGAYRVGGARLRYYGKDDGKVYASDGEAEMELLDLSGEGAAVLQARLAHPASGSLWLNILTASGAVRVYELAADGLSLASPTPAATATAADLFAETGAPALIDVSADGLALFFVTSSGDAVHVARSADWGLVDCVAYNASAATFPWRNAIPQTPTPSVADISPLTVPSASETFASPQIWPWADAAIYRKIGWGAVNITSTFAGMTPGDDYLAEYHFAENYYTAAGKRVYNLKINNELKFENLDSFVVSGNTSRKAVALAYGTTADSAGRVVFTLEKKIDNPIYCGFAVNGREAPSALRFGTEFARDGSTGRLSWGARDALAYYVQSAPSGDGPWTTILRDQTAKTLDVSPGAENTVYYRVVASNGVGTAASAARCSKDKYTVYAVNCGYDLARHGRFAPDDHHVDSDVMYSRDENLHGKSPELSAANEHSVPPEIARTAIFYVKEAADNMEYAFPNLNPGKTYDVRIYCQETFMGEAGSRVFSLKANGETVISGIDAFARAGGKFTLVEYVCKGLSPDAEGMLSLVFVKEVTDPDISAIEIVENDSARVPLVPVVHGVFARNDGVQVCIGSGTGELTYDVRRRPAAGGEYETLVTGLAGYAWLDAGVREGYVYSVRAVDADGAAGAWSGDVAITPAGAGPQAFLGISPTSATFSNANGAYVPYALYLRQNMRLSEAAQAYSHHLVLDPAPDEVYSRIIYTGVGFNFTNLYPSATYRIRLQALESYYTAAGRRVTSGVYANEGQIWGEFDAYREVGKGVFPIDGTVKTTPEGKVNFFTRQTKDNIDFCTVELFLLDGSLQNGVERAVRSGKANAPSWTQSAVPTLDLSGVPEGLPATGNEFIWDAMLAVPADGSYTFDVEQDGDYVLWIDDDVCLEAHGAQPASGTVALGAGAHHLRARYVQGAGAVNVALKWSGGLFARQGIAAAALTKSRTKDLSQGKWLQAEISTAHSGDFYKTGHKTADGSDVWRMTSSAYNFFGAYDCSHFVYQAVKAKSFEARVRLRNIPDRSRDATLALTLRTGLESFGGDYVRQMIGGVANPGANTRWHVGPQGADFTVASPRISNNVRWDVQLPMWMRVRKWRENGKDLAEFSYSLDAENPAWTVSVTNELTSASPIYVGVEACPYTADRLVTYEFDHFELDVPPPAGTLLLVR